MRRLCVYAMLAGLLGIGSLRATTVLPTDFEALVNKAELIFSGTVKFRESRWDTYRGRKAIVTEVQFQVESVLKGSGTSPLKLRFLGGTVGVDSLEVEGIPDFKMGEQVIVFARTNGAPLCPVVGFYHGKLSVSEGPGGTRTLLRHDGTVLTRIEQVGAEKEETVVPAQAGAGAAPRAPITPDDFKQRIAALVARKP